MGGVIVDSPFDTFARYEALHGLPEGFIRALNVSDPDNNAWARLERNELAFDEFCVAFSAEAEAAGGALDAAELFAMLSGDVRPRMLDVVRRCHEHFSTGLLTNNFVTPLDESAHRDLKELFDVVIESAVVGIRKPDPRFYLLACEALGIEPQNAVFLDDLGVNLKPARALGMVTIKVAPDPAQAISELEAVLGLDLS